MSADTHAAWAYDLMTIGNYDRAILDLDSAIRLDPKMAWFWNSRGCAWHMKGVRGADRAV